MTNQKVKLTEKQKKEYHNKYSSLKEAPETPEGVLNILEGLTANLKLFSEDTLCLYPINGKSIFEQKVGGNFLKKLASHAKCYFSPDIYIRNSEVILYLELNINNIKDNNELALIKNKLHKLRAFISSNITKTNYKGLIIVAGSNNLVAPLGSVARLSSMVENILKHEIQSLSGYYSEVKLPWEVELPAHKYFYIHHIFTCMPVIEELDVGVKILKSMDFDFNDVGVDLRNEKEEKALRTLDRKFSKKNKKETKVKEVNIENPTEPAEISNIKLSDFDDFDDFDDFSELGLKNLLDKFNMTDSNDADDISSLFDMDDIEEDLEGLNLDVELKNLGLNDLAEVLNTPQTSENLEISEDDVLKKDVHEDEVIDNVEQLATKEKFNILTSYNLNILSKSLNSGETIKYDNKFKPNAIFIPTIVNDLRKMLVVFSESLQYKLIGMPTDYIKKDFVPVTIAVNGSTLIDFNIKPLELEPLDYLLGSNEFLIKYLETLSSQLDDAKSTLVDNFDNFEKEYYEFINKFK